MNLYKRVAAYVDLDAVERNMESMKANIASDTKVAASIKTDGYGHGAVPIAQLLEEKAYVWGYLTATVEEAMELRKAQIKKPILILGYTFPEAYETIVALDIRPTVFRLDMAQALSKEAVRQNKEVMVHIKVDTGMGRLGFADTQESVEIIREIQALPGIRLEGVFTHFAKADEAKKEATEKQLKRYQEFVKACTDAGISFELKHVSNSAGIIDHPEANFQLVRAGIAIYGLYPSEEVKKNAVPLTPVMELKSHIVHVKEVEAGTPISYGGTYVAKTSRRIATIPVGYGDGYPRGLSNKGYVLIAGKKAPICGRICMDQFMVDVTDIAEAEPGMEVTLIGRDGAQNIRVEELGELSGRFNYEFVCDISKRVPRIYKKDGQIAAVKDWYRL